MNLRQHHAMRGIETYVGKVCLKHPRENGLRRACGQECVSCALLREERARRRAKLRGVPYAVDAAIRRAKVTWERRQRESLEAWLTAP